MSNTVSDKKPAQRTPRCPICGQPRAAAFRPFCSKHCADVDLHRWLSGRYRVPAAESDEPDEEDRKAQGPA